MTQQQIDSRPRGPDSMARRIRAHDWTSTPLGPIDRWPASLRTAVDLALASDFAMAIHWGEDGILIYNDRCAELFGTSHPRALGRPMPDAAHARVRAGETVTLVDQRIPIVRNGTGQHTWFTVSHSPIPDERGGVGGVLVTAVETPRTLSDLCPDAMLVIASGAVEYANRAAARLFGARDVDDLLDRPSRDLFTDEQYDELRPRGTSRTEMRIRTLAGDDVDAEITAAETTWHGRPAAALVLRDVTSRTRADAALRESEELQAFLLRLGDALRPLSDPIAIQEVAVCLLGRHLEASRAHYAEVVDDVLQVRAGYGPRGAASAGSYPIGVFGKRVVEAYRRGQGFAVDDVHAHPMFAGEDVSVYDRAGVAGGIVIPIPKGARSGAVLAVGTAAPRAWKDADVRLAQEVAERTWAAVARARAEQELGHSNARFRTLVENVRDYAIFMLDRDGFVSEWTTGAERIKGYTAPEIVGEHVARFYTAEDIAAGAVERLLAEASATGRSEREGWRQRKDGTRFWANEIVTAIRDASGALVGFTKVSRDLTEQKRLREQREELLAAATEANRAKDEFLATLSHELRTPLAAILLWAGALREGAVPLDELPRAIDAIVQSAQSQSRLIEDLLDLSRLASGRLTLAPRSADVAALARAAIEALRPFADAKSLELELILATGLGYAVLDPDRLGQVLRNLLSNAIKFTGDGGRIALRVARRDDWLEAVVTDTGEGIAPEFLAHVFERFRQADMRETRRHAGLGIGLAVSRSLVELHGGTIEAESEGLGRGAAFRVRLPWRSGAPASRTSAFDGHGAAAPLRGVRVLLVEDDEGNRDAMRWTLDRAGAQVVPVGSAAEALAVLDAREGDPSDAVTDVLVADIGLPGASGYELVELLIARARARGISPMPACAVSAHARDVDRRRAIDAGFDFHVAKPVTPERLVAAVQDLREIAEGQARS